MGDASVESHAAQPTGGMRRAGACRAGSQVGSLSLWIRVRPSGSPTYVSMKDDDWFYVRLGNSTRRLSTREAVDYTAQRWGT